jgi:hypothetical protein
MDKSVPFTPLGSPAIYRGRIEKKSSFVIDNGVRAPLFLAGFTAGADTETKDIDETRRIGVRSNESLTARAKSLFLYIKDKT